VDFTFRNTPTLIKAQTKLLEKISKHDDVFFTFSKGIYETTIILSDSMEDEVMSIFKTENMIYKIDKLSSITIKLPEEIAQVFGVFYHILKKLAYQGINILELVSTTHEFTIVVLDDDVDSAFSVLKNLKNEKL